MDPVLNRATIDVEYVDGTKSRFELKALTIRQLYQFCTDYASEKGVELVALCTGQPVEMIDRLTVDSFVKLYDAIFAANFEKAMTLVQRDPSLAGKVVPAVMKAHKSLSEFATVARSGGSATPSPAPAPSASVPATGSASSTTPPPASTPSSAPTESSKPNVP